MKQEILKGITVTSIVFVLTIGLGGALTGCSSDEQKANANKETTSDLTEMVAENAQAVIVDALKNTDEIVANKNSTNDDDWETVVTESSATENSDDEVVMEETSAISEVPAEQ